MSMYTSNFELNVNKIYHTIINHTPTVKYHESTLYLR